MWEESGGPGENPHRLGESMQTLHRQWHQQEIKFFFLINFIMKWRYLRTCCTPDVIHRVFDDWLIRLNLYIEINGRHIECSELFPFSKYFPHEAGLRESSVHLAIWYFMGKLSKADPVFVFCTHQRILNTKNDFWVRTIEFQDIVNCLMLLRGKDWEEP